MSKTKKDLLCEIWGLNQDIQELEGILKRCQEHNVKLLLLLSENNIKIK